MFPIGVSDGRASKFKVGFYRRPYEKIRPNADRQQFEEKKESFANATQHIRHQRLTEWNTRNGNVLQPNHEQETLSSTFTSLSTSIPLFQTRRHFPTRSAEVSNQNHQRQKIGAARFHIQLTPNEEEYRQRTIVKRLESQKQTTSLLGFGRSDLPTEGVVDNFKSHPYTDSDIISRPKLKPPPANILAAQSAGGGFTIEDGSGYGRSLRASSAGVHSTTPIRTFQPRSNRSNQTSAALAEAFHYQSVDSWEQQKRAGGGGGGGNGSGATKTAQHQAQSNVTSNLNRSNVISQIFAQDST